MDNSETAYAKVNLALHILGRRDDGYHDIDTIFAFMDEGDHISVQPSDTIELNITGPFAADIDCAVEDNLIAKVAHKMRAHYDVQGGAYISLIKNLPISSGIGGGSADAAATARLLNRHWNLGLSMEQLAVLLESLGADIHACIYSKTCRGKGIGSDLEFLDDLKIADIPILLVNPRVAVSTGPIFAAWDGKSGGALGPIDLQSIIQDHSNDMQRAAITLFPQISQVLETLQRDNPQLSRMSGSGATCFALYDSVTQRDNAQAYIEQHHSDWWCMSGKLK